MWHADLTSTVDELGYCGFRLLRVASHAQFCRLDHKDTF